MKYINHLFLSVFILLAPLHLHAVGDDEGPFALRRIVKFNRLAFLKEALQRGDLDESPERGVIRSHLAQVDRATEQTTELCWRALHAIKHVINRDNRADDRPFTYHCMTKLYLTTGYVPTFQISTALPTNTPLSHGDMTQYLEERLYEFGQTRGKVQRWSNMLRALLFMSRIPHEEGPDAIGSAAFARTYLERANAEKGNKTVYVILAALYHHYGELLGKTAPEAHSIRDEYLEKAQTARTNRPCLRKNAPMSRQSYLANLAKPSRVLDANVQDEIRNLIADQEVRARRERDLAAPELPAIPVIASRAAHRLPAHQINHQIVTHQRGTLQLRKPLRTFDHWDVSAIDNRCFFEALGLNPDSAISRLQAQYGNITLRAMVANEIVGAWHTRVDLNPSLLEALGVEDLIDLQDRLDRLQLAVREGEHQNYLETEQAYIINEVRRRASTPEAFQAFIRFQMLQRQNNDPTMPFPMMAVHRSTEENGHPVYSLTSANAITSVHNIGLRVYTLARGNQTLKLIHEFVPHGSETVAHVFYDPASRHFSHLHMHQEQQVESREPVITAAHQASYEAKELTAAFAEILQNQFPAVTNNTGEDDDLVRYVLYMKSLGFTTKRMGEDPLCPWSRSRAGTIVNENGVQRETLDPAIVSRFFDFFIRSGLGGTGKPHLVQLIEQILARMELDIATYRSSFLNMLTMKRHVPETTKEVETQICELYRQGKPFHEIRGTAKAQSRAGRISMLHPLQIVDIIRSHSPELAIPVLEDPIVLNVENTEARNQRIIDTWDRLRAENENVLLQDVADATKLSYKIVRKALSDAGRWSGKRTAAHLDHDKKAAIWSYWQAQGYGQTRGQTTAEKKLVAEYFGVSPVQVNDIVREGRKFKRIRGSERYRPSPSLRDGYNHPTNERDQAN